MQFNRGDSQYLTIGIFRPFLHVYLCVHTHHSRHWFPIHHFFRALCLTDVAIFCRPSRLENCYGRAEQPRCGKSNPVGRRAFAFRRSCEHQRQETCWRGRGGDPTYRNDDDDARRDKSERTTKSWGLECPRFIARPDRDGEGHWGLNDCESWQSSLGRLSFSPLNPHSGQTGPRTGRIESA